MFIFELTCIRACIGDRIWKRWSKNTTPACISATGLVSSWVCWTIQHNKWQQWSTCTHGEQVLSAKGNIKGLQYWQRCVPHMSSIVCYSRSCNILMLQDTAIATLTNLHKYNTCLRNLFQPCSFSPYAMSCFCPPARWGPRPVFNILHNLRDCMSSLQFPT